MRLVVLVALTGCTEEEEGRAPRPSAPAPVSPAVELGTGDRAYEPLAPGDTVIVWHGQQGGYHVEVGAHVVGLPETVAVDPTIRAAATGEVLTQPSPAYLALAEFDEDSASGTFWGVQARLDAGMDPAGVELVCGLEGQGLLLEVSVSEIGGTLSADASLEVVATVDPEFAAVYCD